MPVIAKYGISGKDYGILSVAFPRVRQIRRPFWEFVSESKVIVIADDRYLKVYPDKEVIQICCDAEMVLDTKRGFLKFLGSQGVRCGDREVNALLQMDDCDFWKEAKLAAFLKYFPTIKDLAENCGKLYRLYDALFENFGTVYREYRQLHQLQTHTQILSGLLSMHIKGLNVNRRGDIGLYYRNILLKNRKFELIFKCALQEYLEYDGKQTEMNFVRFLWACSHRGQWRSLIDRNPMWP